MPEVRVQVLYDFEYTTKEGREVWMREGERLYLIKKTNPDWWQVLRNSERRPFYVPSAYVEEVHPKKTKNSFRSNRLDEVEPRTTECDAGERTRPYLNGRGKKLEEGHRATIKQLQQHHQRLTAASQERQLEESRQRRRRGADYEIASLLPQVSLSHRGRGGDTDGSADKEEDNTPIRRETRVSVVNQRDIRGRHSSTRLRGRRIVDEEEDYRFVEGGGEEEEEEDRGRRQGRSASLDHLRRRLTARGRATAREATGARSGEVSSCDDDEEEAPEEEIRLPRPRPSAFASPGRGVAALMGNSHGSRSDDNGLGKLGRSSGRKSGKGSQGTKKQQKKEGDELLPVPLAFRNLVYQDDEGVVDYAQEAGVDERDNTAARADENSGEVSEVAAHSASTLHTPSSPSPANTTLPRLLRPPTSPLRARSSPSTPTLPTATAHHHHHHQRSGTPPPSSSPSSAASSASSSPTYVSAAPFPETTPPPAVAALPPPRRPTSSTSTTSVGGGSSSLLPPPSPTPGQQAVRQLANGWSEYCDASGRTFFHNEGSGEKSWKPPRRRARKEDTTDGSRSCSSSPLAETDDTTNRAITIPAGWRESYDSSMEQSCYVNLVTGAKWYSSNDMEGRAYFFEENSNESSWTLPEVTVVSQPQTPPPVVVSGSPAGSDSFISGRSSGGEEGSRDAVERDGSSHSVGSGMVGVSRDDMVAMPIVKMKMDQWEKGGRLIQLRENSLEKDLRGGGRSTRAAKTRSMVIGDPGMGEVKIPLPVKVPSAKDWPQLWDGNMYVLKEGTLNKTKITENKKRVRKNWAPSHVVLTELFLLFFKDAKTFAALKSGSLGGNVSPGDSGAMPELCVDLNGALVDRDDQLSSRRNVFRVSTVLGLQVLCQDDNAQNVESWYQSISGAISKLPSGFDGSPRQQNPVEIRNFLEPNSPDEQKKFPRIGRSKSVKVKKDASMEDLSSTNSTERQVKIKARLKKFFHRRPTMETLVKKGIWKDEPAFGSYLEQVSGEGIPRIPLFVQRCIAAIESKPENMKADGLYRASGNLSQVQKIRLQVDQNNLSIVDMEEDVHVLTGALKLFFRELKEPLIPYSLFNRALTASTNSNKKEQLHEFKEIVKILPVANYDTLKYLLQHLLRVTSYQDFNRMHIANLAIVFGPTLMWPKQESLNMALDLMQQNLVIECLLQEFDTIFSTGR